MSTLQPARAAGPIAALGLSLAAGVAGWSVNLVLVGAASAVALTTIVLAWPRGEAYTTSRARVLTVLLILYLVPLFILGRAFPVAGKSPVFLPDVLITFAAVLMLPKVRLRSLSWFTVLCGLIALLALHAVYVGTS